MHCGNVVEIPYWMSNFVGMGQGDDYEDSSIDVYAYFNSSCYDGYFDDDQVSLNKAIFSTMFTPNIVA